MRSLCLLLVVSISGVAQVATSGEFRDDELGFAFTTPTLGAPPTGQQLQRIQLMGPRVDNFSPNVTVQIKQIQSTRESMIENSDKDFAASGMTVSAKNLREVSGLPAVSYECRWTYQNMPLQMINLVVVEPNRMIILTCTALQASFPAHEAEFRKAIDSFVVRR